MSSHLLQVPDGHIGARSPPPPRKMMAMQHVALQEIPSWRINPSQLNSLLISIFPAGGYDVDVRRLTPPPTTLPLSQVC